MITRILRIKHGIKLWKISNQGFGFIIKFNVIIGYFSLL